MAKNKIELVPVVTTHKNGAYLIIYDVSKYEAEGAFVGDEIEADDTIGFKCEMRKIDKILITNVLSENGAFFVPFGSCTNDFKILVGATINGEMIDLGEMVKNTDALLKLTYQVN